MFLFIYKNVLINFQEFNEFKPDGLTDVILKQELSNRSIVDDLLLLFSDPPLNIKTAGKNKFLFWSTIVFLNRFSPLVMQ